MLCATRRIFASIVAAHLVPVPEGLGGRIVAQGALVTDSHTAALLKRSIHALPTAECRKRLHGQSDS